MHRRVSDNPVNWRRHDMLVQHDTVDEQRHWTGTGLGITDAPRGGVDAACGQCGLLVAHDLFLRNRRVNVARREDRKEIAGSTTIFSDLTAGGRGTSGKLREVLKRRGSKAVSLFKCGTEMAVA